MQGVAGEVEEEHIAQAQHQARHRHRHEAEQAQQQVQAALALGFFHQVGAGENHRAADQRRTQGHGQAVAVGQPAATGGFVELVVLERQRQVVGPELDQGGVHRHAHHQQQHCANQYDHGQKAGIAAPRRLWLEHLGTAAHRVALAAAQPGIDSETEQRRHQQDHADQGTTAELLLADHRLVGFQRQHLIIATNHHRHTEVGDGQGEHQAEGGEHRLPGRRPGDAVKRAPRPGAHARGRIEQTRIGQRQRRQQDHQCMREGVDGFTEDNAPEAVDVVAEQPAQQALVAEQVDQGNGRQHRRRQQRQQRDAAPQALGRNQSALQGIGEQVGQRHHDCRNTERDLEAIAQQPVKVGTGKQFAGGNQATALAGITAETAPEDRQQWHQDRDSEQKQQQPLAADHEQSIPQRYTGALCCLRVCDRHGDWRGHLRQTPADCAAARRPRYPGSPGAASTRGRLRQAGHGPAVR
ncbi:hypothetical protein D3C77_384440 [compost metagenome]